MSEKRFSLEHYDRMPYVQDNLNGDEYYLKWAVELMNELAEENEALKRFIKDNFNDMMDSKMVVDDEL